MQKITDQNRYQMLLVNLQEKMTEVFAQSIGVASIEDGEVLEFFSRKAELLIGSFVDEFGYMKITDKLELVVNRHCDIDEKQQAFFDEVWTTEFPIGKEASAHFLNWVTAYDKIPNLEGPGFPKSGIALALAEAQISEARIDDFVVVNFDTENEV